MALIMYYLNMMHLTDVFYYDGINMITITIDLNACVAFSSTGNVYGPRNAIQTQGRIIRVD